ncbi:hypothetical protein OIU85_025137 [Salix viminalis]|uniref:Uncharacterized protein n=1 Tax=Salix viminalis TaxID=40686 RepID=A0A9Q0Z5F1_SALVM|nr:hypothetical protein OIU85_025137 [Salix viminalis]
MSNFNFDFGIGSNRPKSLNDQRNPKPSPYSSSTSQSKPTWQPNKPSWTHQPAPAQSLVRPGGLNGPTSMVGDITGKSWNSGIGSGSGIGIGIVEKNPNLFGDLVTSAIGNTKVSSNSNVPLKNVNTSAYSMGNLADSLPKTSGSTAKSGGGWGGNGNLGGYSSGYNRNDGNANASVGVNKSSNLGGASMKSMSGGGMSGSKDPFGSLVDFEMKQKKSSLNSASKVNKPSGNATGDAFGAFQNAPSAKSVPSGGVGASSNDFMGSNTSSKSNIDDFGVFVNSFPTQKQQAPVQPSVGDPLDMFFTPSSGDAATVSGGLGGQPFSEVDDWGLDSGLGGGGVDDSHGATTELDGLPAPPAGVTASAAKNKGIENQKQGQYADAIKWLSWAVVLLEKTGDKASTMEVLSSRASCYKEVGEYKKAVADCSKVLLHDDANVAVLVQRALLYESMEKYRLGAEDMRVVLKIDPANRVARSTIHRLTKMAD